jgi:hypothetical protein
MVVSNAGLFPLACMSSPCFVIKDASRRKSAASRCAQAAPKMDRFDAGWLADVPGTCQVAAGRSMPMEAARQ